jgi:seryl-tRNA synthetase
LHDLRLLREHPDVLRDAVRRRGAWDELGPVLARAEDLEARRRVAIQALERKQAERNALSASVRDHKRTGADASDLIERGRVIGAELDTLERERADVESALASLNLELPNVTLPDVPAGGTEANTVVRAWGEPRVSGGVRPHWEIGESLGILDLARGAKIAGSGFVAFRGVGSRLVRAMLTFTTDLQAREHGYEEVWVPFVANRAAMMGTAQFPKFEDEQYAICDDDLFLIPTGEVPVTNLYRDEIVEAAWLPHGFVAYTPCFRREAGAAGKDTRGLLRLHQFDKVELVRYCAPEDSPAQLELLTRHAEEVLRRLELPYRVVLLAAGDTGFASAKTYDLEVWAPGVGKWLEVSSCSTFTDFQARRANIRFRPERGKTPRFVHTLNGSSVGFPRTIAAILEHYQQPDGSVRVPEALRPYIGVDRLG